MHITTYNSTYDRKTLDKSGITQIADYESAHLTDGCSMIRPRFRLKTPETDPVKANYLFCHDWDRYYFINDFDFVPGNAMIFDCVVDPLYSFMDQLKNVSGTILRNEHAQNSYIVDTELPILVRKSLEIIRLENSDFQLSRFNSDTHLFLMTIAGGAIT